MDQQTYIKSRRTRIRREMLLRLAEHDRAESSRAARNEALNRLMLHADGKTREDWWNRIEVIAVITVLVIVEMLHTGGLL